MAWWWLGCFGRSRSDGAWSGNTRKCSSLLLAKAGFGFSLYFITKRTMRRQKTRNAKRTSELIQMFLFLAQEFVTKLTKVEGKKDAGCSASLLDIYKYIFGTVVGIRERRQDHHQHQRSTTQVGMAWIIYIINSWASSNPKLEIQVCRVLRVVMYVCWWWIHAQLVL